MLISHVPQCVYVWYERMKVELTTKHNRVFKLVIELSVLFSI